jgi:general secretion pathway protein D
MRKIIYCWIIISGFFLLVGMMSCSGIKSEKIGGSVGETSQDEASSPPTMVAMLSSQQASPDFVVPAKLSKIEKMPEKKETDPSIPRPEDNSLPLTRSVRLSSPNSQTEGPKVDPGRRFLIPPTNSGLDTTKRVKREEARAPSPAPPPETPPVSKEMKKAKKIIDVRLEEGRDFITFMIIGDGKVEGYHSFKLASPTRFILDISGIGSPYTQKLINVKSSLVKKVRIGHNQDKLRFVFDSQKPQLPPYQIHQLGDKLIVSFGNAPRPQSPPTNAPEPKSVPTFSQRTPPPLPASQPSPTPSSPESTQPIPMSPPLPRPQPQPQAVPQPSPAPSPPQTPPAPQRSQATPQMVSGVVFNFDNADIYEVIRVMAEIMKITYIIDPKVKGVVNIHTSGQISSQNLFPIFQSILRLNGATAVHKDGVYEIVPLSDAKKLSISPSVAQESGRPSFEEKYTIQIVSLKYIPVAEVSKMIKPFLSDGADIVEHPPHNILIIGDVASNVKKSVDIIGLFDIDIFTDLRVRIYPILNSDVTEIAKEMERIFSSFEVSTKSGRGVGITFTPVSRINSLLVVSSIPNIFEKVEGWLRELDKVPAEGGRYGVFVYYVQNAKAKDLAEVLKEIFMTTKEKKADYKEKVTEQPAFPKGVKPPPTSPSTPPSKEEGTAIPEGEINIVVDETTNSLVIRAFARDYKNILETVKKLDLYPKQVLIEVLLAEITLDDTNKFGIEWARFIDKAGVHTIGFGTTPGSPPIDPYTAATALPLPGAGTLRYSIIKESERLSAAIKLAATENRLKIVSSPHLLASNNKEAKMQVGKAQPVLTSTYAYGSTTTSGTVVSSTTTPSTGLIEGTIEYKDIGIILTVTPRVSDGGLITLELQIEKSDVNTDALPLGNLQNVPVFTKKTAKTILSVNEAQTIVIGGLIEDTKDVKKSGIPLLSKIPIIGALFGSQEYTFSKTELVLLMTPHIITDHIQSKNVTEEFKEKVEGLKKELEKERMRKEKK